MEKDKKEEYRIGLINSLSKAVANLLDVAIHYAGIDLDGLAHMLYRSGLTLDEINEYIQRFDEDGELIEDYYTKEDFDKEEF